MKENKRIKICNLNGKEIIHVEVTNDIANAFLNILLELKDLNKAMI